MFDQVLVPLDGSSLAECVLPHAVALAQPFEARVRLLRVLEHVNAIGQAGSVDPLGWHIGKAETEAYLEKTAARLRQVGLRADGVLLEGQAAERIITFAHEQDVDLLVLSSHGRSGLSGWNVSSIVQKIILRVYKPLMIVRAYQPISQELGELRYKRLLVPLDCSQRAECVLPLAASLARFHKSKLLVVHVVSKPQMPRRASPTPEDVQLANRVTERNRTEAVKLLEQVESRLDVDVEARVMVRDNVAATLHELVQEENIDLVLLSAHGHSGGARWPYGSMVVNFIGYGTTPLFIVQDLSPGEIERTMAESLARERGGH